ncbi:Ferri-bacillibactin esterase BesA [compost metagenome]
MLYSKWEEVKPQFTASGRTPELLVIVGTEEKESMIRDARELVRRLRLTETGLSVMFKEIEEEGHVSVLPSLMSPLLRFATQNE